MKNKAASSLAKMVKIRDIFTAVLLVSSFYRTSSMNAVELLFSAEKEARIIGGQTAAAEKYDYFVEWEVGCGGSLINENVILTSAHCLKNSWNRNVRIGSHQRSDGLEATIAGVSFHPEYDMDTERYDFAILVLDEPVLSSIVAPVKLNSDPHSLNSHDDLTVIGLGQITYGEPGPRALPDTLQEVIIPFIATERCSNMYGNELIDEKSMLCAGESGKDSCVGDSGSPILDSNGDQVGLVSFGKGCGQPGYPGVYARVSGAIEWITRHACYSAEVPSHTCEPSYPVFIEIEYDYFAIENSWSIRNADGDLILMSPVGNVELPGVSFRKLNLPPGIYTFEINDTYGDGICCEYLGGGYSFRSGEEVVEGSGEFGYSSITNFEVTAQGGIREYQHETLTGTHRIRLDINRDANPEEIAWMLTDVSTGELVYLLPYGSMVGTGLFSVTFEIPNGHYWLAVVDSGNDGICCESGDGGIEIVEVLNGVDISVLGFRRGDYEGGHDFYFDLS